jgi:hypothetical protein
MTQDNAYSEDIGAIEIMSQAPGKVVRNCLA